MRQLTKPYPFKPPINYWNATSPAGSSLLTGLTAYYALSDLTDSTGGTSLTNHGSVTFNANGANFVSASNQWLSHADQAAFHFGTTDFSFCFWMKSTSSTNFGQCFNYGGRANAPSIYVELSISFGGRLEDSLTDILDISEGIHAYNDGNFHLYICTVARAGNYKVIVDNTTYTNSSAASLGPMNSTIGLGLGADETGNNKYDGALKGVGMWTKSLSGTETASLWNGGTPLLYPF